MPELKRSRQRLALVMVAVALVAGGVIVVGAQVVINEVSYTGAGADDWIEIKNLGPGTADVSNYWFCARFSYARVGLVVLLDGTDFVLDPGEIVTVRAWRDRARKCGRRRRPLVGGRFHRNRCERTVGSVEGDEQRWQRGSVEH